MYLDEPGRSRHPRTPTGHAAGLLRLLRATHWWRSGLLLPLRRQCHATLPGVPEQPTQAAQVMKIRLGHTARTDSSVGQRGYPTTTDRGNLVTGETGQSGGIAAPSSSALKTAAPAMTGIAGSLRCRSCCSSENLQAD